MNSEDKIIALYTALNALNEIPAMKLAENGTLVREIKSIVNSKQIASIVSDIANEHRMYTHNQSIKGGFDNNLMANANKLLKQQEEDRRNSNLLTNAYVQYQNSVFNHVSQSKKYGTRYTEPIQSSEIRAFNQRKLNPYFDAEVKKSKWTRKFIEVFNSIYSSESIQIGTENDPTRISSYVDYSPYIYNYQYYLSIPTLAPTIDFPISLATREMPDLIFEDDSLSENIEKHLRRTGFNDKIKKMLLYSSLSPRGALIVPILEKGRVRFNTFNDTQFTYAATNKYTNIDYKDNSTGVNQLFCLGHILQNDVTAHFLCPGFEPIFAVGKNKTFQLKDAAEAVNIYLYTIKVLCIRAQVLVQNWDGEGQNDTKLSQLKKLADNISSNLSLSTAVKVPQGASLEILNNNINDGFSKVSPIIKEYQGMLSGVMPDYFYGSDTAYNANAFNLNVTHQNVKSQIQEDQIGPLYRFCVNFLLEHDNRFKKYSNEIDNFDIEFKSLYEPTQAEKAETEAKMIDNLIKMSDYPELEDIFKKEGILRDEHTFKDILPKEGQPET